MAVTANSFITAQTPVWGAQGQALSTALTAGNAYDGTQAVGTAMVLVYTVGANGGYVSKLTFRPGGITAQTASGTSTASVARVWVNNGSANTTATNNVLIAEVTLPAFTISAAAATAGLELAINKSLPAGYKIYVGIGTSIGGTQCCWYVSAEGADL